MKSQDFHILENILALLFFVFINDLDVPHGCIPNNGQRTTLWIQRKSIEKCITDQTPENNRLILSIKENIYIKCPLPSLRKHHWRAGRMDVRTTRWGGVLWNPDYHDYDLKTPVLICTKPIQNKASQNPT